jgi:hypothetical protein
MKGELDRRSQDMTETSRKRSPNRLPPLPEKAPAIGIWSQLFIIELGSASIARLLHSLLVGEPAATPSATSTRQEARHGGSENRP